MMVEIVRIRQRIEKLRGRATVLARKSRRLSNVRLALALFGLAAVYFLWTPLGPLPALLAGLAVAVAFAKTALIHDRVEKARRRNALWQSLHTRHRARLELDWDALPDPPDPAPLNHPYAGDLDIAGPRSLLHALDTTITMAGRARLRAFLLAPPDFIAARQRQTYVRALAGHRRFRDRLMLLGMEAAFPDRRWDHDPIEIWLARPHGSYSWKKRTLFLLALALVNWLLVIVHIAGGPAWWFYTAPVYAVLYLPVIPRLTGRIEHLFRLGRELSGLTGVLMWVEAYKPRLAPDLKRLWTPISGASSPTLFKKSIDRLRAFGAYTEEGSVRLLVNALVPYDLLLLWAYDRLHARLAPAARTWIDAYGEIEALNALASYADLHAAHSVFPELLASDEPARVVGRGIAHPLLPDASRIANDLAQKSGQVAIITGSNMSGKSTFLRAAGIASVMAWAGGPVCAASLSISPFRVFTSMRLGDAIQDGTSTFYAEVLRLRDLMASIEDAPSPPALILIDEMLRGTNTRERLIGVQAIVRALAGARAVSLIATHDQEVTRLAGELTDVSNFHFKERIEGDRLVFDYKIQPGPSDTTNALVIMRRAGLPVPGSPLDDARPS